MQSSSSRRTRRAVLAIVIVGSLASIATSYHSQRATATLPPVSLSEEHPRVALRIQSEVAETKANPNAGLTLRLRTSSPLRPGDAKLRITLWSTDGRVIDGVEADAAERELPSLSGDVWVGCLGKPCAESHILRAELVTETKGALTAPLELSGEIHVESFRSKLHEPIKITVMPAS